MRARSKSAGAVEGAALVPFGGTEEREDGEEDEDKNDAVAPKQLPKVKKQGEK